MVKNGVTYRLISDYLGSVRYVVDVSTGTITQTVDYDEYGVVEYDSNPGFSPFGFAGGMYDHETGLVRFGVRDYDAESGRWTCKDPIDFDGGDVNFYVYCWNDPINFTDKDGLNATGATIGVVIGGTIGAVIGAGAGTIALPGGGTIGGGTYGAMLGAMGGAAIGGLIGDIISNIWEDDVCVPYYQYEEHTKNKTKANKGKHDKGNERRKKIKVVKRVMPDADTNFKDIYI